MRRLCLFVLLLAQLALPSWADAQPVAACPAEQNLSRLGRPTEQAQLLAVGSRRTPQRAQLHVVARGETLGQIARRYRTTVQSFVAANDIADPNHLMVGQRLLVPGTIPPPPPLYDFPFQAVWVDGVAQQGQTALLWVQATPGSWPWGRLGDQVIPFQRQCHLFWGLVAFDALHDLPGSHTATLFAADGGGQVQQLAVAIPLQGVGYWEGPPVRYPPEKQPLLDPETIRAENEWLSALFAAQPYSAPRWSAPFARPTTTIVTGSFGARGVVDGKYTGYHEGIDYRGPLGTPIGAAAPGIVLVARPLTVRGNAVFLDHGGGVITGYFHMSQLAVQEGQSVQAGTVLGWVGGTGLTTGPHLHWELRVNGRWVDPYPWLVRSFP